VAESVLLVQLVRLARLFCRRAAEPPTPFVEFVLASMEEPALSIAPDPMFALVVPDTSDPIAKSPIFSAPHQRALIREFVPRSLVDSRALVILVTADRTVRTSMIVLLPFLRRTSMRCSLVFPTHRSPQSPLV
jgi:hypothetical protein